MQFRTRLPTTIALTLLISGCATSRSTAPSLTSTSPRPSGTLAPSVYYEEGKLAFVAVNVHLARFRLDAELIPVEIAVANRGLDLLRVSPEHLTLRSLEGEAWPVASPEESAGSSLRSSFDRNLMPVPFEEVVKLQLPNHRFVRSTFDLRRGNRTMTRSVELRRNHWTLAQLWFPSPGRPLKGELFELWMDSPDLPEPVFTTVRF